RARQAQDGIQKLRENVDTLIVIPNEKLLAIVERRTTILDAFREADNVLRQGVQGITDLITIPGLINLDFADVRTIMHDAGTALIDDSMGDEVRVTVIATGFDHGHVRPSAARETTRQRRRDRDVTMDERQRSSLEIRDDEIDIPSFLKDR